MCVTARIARPTAPGQPIEELPWDGESSGELQVSGPWIAAAYYDDPRSPESFTDDGWLKTGDVAVIDAHGYIRLVDRTKDVIKSGGEWISSVDLENELMGHPTIAEAAVIGVAHQKWGERPLACVVLRPDEARHQGRAPRLARAPGGEVVAARRRRLRRRDPQDQRRQVLEEGPPLEVRGLRVADGLSTPRGYGLRSPHYPPPS